VAASTLRRNREFLLLQFSQLVSSGGSQITAIAYPLLVLSLTGSSAKAGIVAFVRLVPVALLSLPAGVAADRLNRRWLMIAAHVLRALAVGTLAVLVAGPSSGRSPSSPSPKVVVRLSTRRLKVVHCEPSFHGSSFRLQ
jgi:MFS family permease